MLKLGGSWEYVAGWGCSSEFGVVHSLLRKMLLLRVFPRQLVVTGAVVPGLVVETIVSGFGIRMNPQVPEVIIRQLHHGQGSGWLLVPLIHVCIF